MIRIVILFSFKPKGRLTTTHAWPMLGVKINLHCTTATAVVPLEYDSGYNKLLAVFRHNQPVSSGAYTALLNDTCNKQMRPGHGLLTIASCKRAVSRS
jgi:hypothetical protein